MPQHLEDPPTFRCPGCGRAVPEAAQAVQTHERFLKKVLDRQEEFRQSLAGAIHDDLIQQLVGALLYLEGARQIQSPPGDGAQDNFRIGLKLLREGIHKSRRIAGRLAAAVRRPS